MGDEGARHVGQALQKNKVKIQSIASYLSNLVFTFSRDTDTN